MFFNDEIPEESLVPYDQLETILLAYKEHNDNVPMDTEEFEKVYSYLESLHMKMLLYDMCLDGLLIMKWDEEKQDIVYTASKAGQKLGENYRKLSDQNAIDRLLDDALGPREDND